MPSAKKVSALVLFRKNIGEADRLVTFFTKEHGLVRAVAKGVRKIPSSRGGHLEPLTKVSVLLNESKARQYGGQAGVYVGAVETEEYFKELHADTDASTRVKRVLHAFMKFFDTGQAVPTMFDALEQSFETLPRLFLGKRMMMESSLYLQTMQLAGVLPELSCCAECGVSKTEDPVVLSFGEGLWRCSACLPAVLAGLPLMHTAENSLSSRQFSVLRYLAVMPHHASRIAIADEEALHVERAVHSLVAHAIEEPSLPIWQAGVVYS